MQKKKLDVRFDVDGIIESCNRIKERTSNNTSEIIRAALHAGLEEVEAVDPEVDLKGFIDSYQEV